MNMKSIFYILLPAFCVMLIKLKKNKFELNHKFWQSQKWNCFDVLLLSGSIAVLQICILFIFNRIMIQPQTYFLYGNLFVTIITTILLIWIISHKYQSKIATLGFSPVKLKVNIIYGLMAFSIYAIFWAMFFMLIKDKLYDSYFSILNLHQWPIFDLMLYVGKLVIITPVMEECIFRGFMYAPFSQKLGSFGSIFTTALIWGLYHYSNGIAGILSISIMGIFLGYLYKVTRSLIPGIIFHSLINIFQILLFFGMGRNL